MQVNYFADEDLIAFLDDEAGTQKADAIREALAKDNELRNRLDALRVDLSDLSTAFAQFQPGQVRPEYHIPTVKRAVAFKPLYAACLALAVVTGFGGGTFWQSQDPGWTDYVAAYHALYSPNTLANVSLTEDEQTTQLAMVGDAIGKDWSLGELPVVPGVSYRRAQLLSFEGRPLVQLSFTTAAGAPLALCIIASPEAGNVAPRPTQAEGMQAVYWSAKGYEYFLVGGTDEDLIARLSAVYTGVQL
ncbi:MAG: hypothetical protein AAFV74_19295 [Pseudomonadota bacterium]